MITTYVADSQLRPEQDHEASPGHGTWTYQLLDAGYLSLTDSRRATILGVDYRAVKYGAWVHDGDQMMPIKAMLTR